MFPLHLVTLLALPLFTFALHNQLLTRQSADCFPIFLEYPTDLFVPCGSLYISNLCTCCPGDVLGCYTAFNVCTTDVYGASLCCPASNPNCGIEAGSTAPAAPTTVEVSESAAPTTTEQSFTDTAGPTTTTQGFTDTAGPTATPVTTPVSSTSPVPVTQSDVKSIVNPTGGQTSTSAASSAVATQSSGSAPPQARGGPWGVLAVLFILNAI